MRVDERARSALNAIPPGIARDKWVRTGMAAKAAGLDFGDFNTWSSGAGNYDAGDAKSAWRSFKPNGGIGAGTLYAIAAEYGWRSALPAKRPTRAKTATTAHIPKSPSLDVSALWNRCKPAGRHPYIDAKHGYPDELRIVPDDEPLTIRGYPVAGWLAVPAYADDAVQSIQFIPAPGHSMKLNMPGASMRGASFTVGVLDMAGPVYMVEGIGQAWACNRATGRPAVVCFGAGNMARIAQKLADYSLVLVPDKGKESDAKRIAADISAAVAFMPEQAPNNYDANDYASRKGHEALAALLEQTTQPSPKYPEPEQLRRPLPPAAPYPMEALGEVLGGAAQAIHEQVQAPAAMCGTSILAAASLAVQGQADVTNDGRREPLTLWAATIGESGERKSAVDEWALRAHRKHEKEAQTEYQAATLEYQTEQAAYDAARQKAKSVGKGNRAAIHKALQEVGEPPELPLQPMLIMGEPTLEGTQKQLIRGWPSIGLFSDDAGEFLGGYSMNKDNRTRTAASLSRLWDKGTFDRVRAKADEPAGKYYGKRCALHLMVQPVIAETVLSDDVLTGQGFLPRCLLAWPDSTIGTREHTPGNLSDSPAMLRYWKKIRTLLDKDYPLAEGTRNELELPALELTQDARDLWIRVYNAIEHKQSENGEYAPVRAWASKSASQVLRIAGVLTLVDNPDAQTIDAAEVERAAELVLWHLSEALRIVGTAAIPREVKDAEKLRDWCHNTGRRLLYSREALQYGPGGIRTKGNFDAAINVLEGAGWAFPIEGGAVLGGKHRRRVWQVVGGEA